MSSDDPAPAPVGSQSFRLGAGLLVGLFLGHRSLIAAATGSEQFELAIAHFVLVVLVSMVGIVTIASTYERLAHTADEEQTDDADAADSLDAGEALVPEDRFAVPELSQASTELSQSLAESSREP